MSTSNNSKPSIFPSLQSPLITTPSPEEEEDHYPPITYNQNPRPYRDLPFLFLFLLLILSTFSLGIIASFNQNPNRSHASSFIYNHSSSSCTISPSHNLHSSSSPFLRDLISTLIITILLSFPIAISLLTLLRHFAKHLVYISIPFSILIPISLNLYWFIAASQFGDSFPLVYRILILLSVFFVIAIVLWIIVSNWNRISLTVHILRIASAALLSNMLLVVVLPCLMLGLLVFFAPIVAFLVVVTFNGRIVASEGGDGLYYCRWKQDGWVPGYFALAIVTMLWSFGTLFEAKVYVTSGVIAQWYFCLEGGNRRGSVRNSLRYGFRGLSVIAEVEM